MTVTYSEDMHSADGLTLLKLVFTRWKGSLMKLVWKDLVVFLSIYYALQAIYFYGITREQRKYFEALVYYAKIDADKIPISFVLGFFVSNVFSRWWSQFEAIPSPSRIAVFVTSTIHGYDEVGRVMRRTIMRYLNLSLVMVFRVLSPRVRKRFQRMDSLIEAGFITESELAILKNIDKKYPNYSKNWLPICWASSIANRARADGRIKDDFALKLLVEEFNNFRGSCGTLMDYHECCIPLVYVQVVTLAVYTFFITVVLGRQAIEPDDNSEYQDLGFLDNQPFLVTLQFIFYMGWLKVAETMINPFGDDDDDFDINSMIDSNLIMSYLIVDEMHSEHPELLKDRYWDALPQKLPDDEKQQSPGVVDAKTKLTDFFDVAVRKRKVSKRSLSVIPLGKEAAAETAPQLFDESRQMTVPRPTGEGSITRPPAITGSLVNEHLKRVRERAVSIRFNDISSSDTE